MKKERKKEQFWDRSASFYDAVEEKDDTYALFFDHTLKYLDVNDIVLDWGCGTGLVCNKIASQVNKIYGIDISSKMLEKARSKAKLQGIETIEFKKTTIFDPYFKASSIDKSIAFNIIHLLDNPKFELEKIYELLKPNGLLISVTPCMKEKPILNFFLQMGSLLGLLPKIQSFSSENIENMLVDEKFEVMASYRIRKSSPQYLIIAKK